MIKSYTLIANYQKNPTFIYTRNDLVNSLCKWFYKNFKVIDESQSGKQKDLMNNKCLKLNDIIDIAYFTKEELLKKSTLWFKNNFRIENDILQKTEITKRKLQILYPENGNQFPKNFKGEIKFSFEKYSWEKPEPVDGNDGYTHISFKYNGEEFKLYYFAGIKVSKNKMLSDDDGNYLLENNFQPYSYIKINIRGIYYQFKYVYISKLYETLLKYKFIQNIIDLPSDKEKYVSIQKISITNNELWREIKDKQEKHGEIINIQSLHESKIKINEILNILYNDTTNSLLRGGNKINNVRSSSPRLTKRSGRNRLKSKLDKLNKL